MHAYEVHARISGVYLIGVYFLGVHLIGMYLMGVHLLWIISLNNLCAKLPRTRIRLALNSHSKSLPRSIPNRYCGRASWPVAEELSFGIY
jgi:hypothetical protein